MISIRHLLPAVVLGFVTWVAASTQPATAPAISFSLSSSSASIAIADAPSRNVVPLTRLAARDAFFVAYVADVPGLLECVEKSPWARGLNDPMWDKTMTVLRPKLAFLSGWDGGTFKSASGLSALDLLSCAKGDAVLFIPQFELPGKLGLDVDKMLGATKGAGAVLALRVGEEAARLRKLLTEAATKTRGEAVLVAVEQVEGATIHTVTVREKNTETGAWETTATVHYTFGGVDGGVFLATSGSKALLQASLARLARVSADGGAGRADVQDDITAHPGYVALRDGTPGTQVVAFLNWQAIYPRLAAAVDQKSGAGEDGEGGGGGAVNLLIPQGGHVLRALGLDVIQHAGIAVAIGAAEMRVDGVLAYTEERGLIKLLAYEAGPVARPDWAPSAGLVQINSFNYNYARAYAGLEGMIGEASPMLLAMAQGYLGQINMAAKVDLKRDLIGSLGNRYVTCVIAPGAGGAGGTGRAATMDEADQLMGFSLRDAATFERAALALTKMFARSDRALWTERVLGGTKIRSVDLAGTADGGAGGEGKGVHFAITKDWLLVCIGRAGSLEAALSASDKNVAVDGTAAMTGGRVSFWQSPAAAESFARVPLPAEAVGVSYTDLPRMFSLLAGTVLASVAEGEGGGVDPSVLPSAADVARFWSYGLSHVKRESDGLHGQTVIVHPK
ncbi:hypothetical protein [Geminisphaera colitermitum]|uniref:hypothetical protein n=1 Tax=Geminisphaera colitermitum TaxID=1148786 RepID=UPI000158C842|nr:hypothetical protein [Geminisphaera colitermitum]